MAISQIPYQIYMLFSMMTRRLDDHNFIVWSYQFQTLLEGQDLFGYINGSTICPPKFVITDDEGVTGEVSTTYKEWKRIDKAILSLLFASLSFDIMDYVVGSKTSREAWMRLSDMYATFSRSQIMQLKTDMYTITKGMDSVEKYLVKVQRVRNQLNVLGVTMEDEDIIVIILNGLPADFNLIKAIIRARESPVSIAELRILLLTVERDIDNRASPNISSSAMKTKKNVSQRCLSGSGNMSENVEANINAVLSSPQCHLTGTSSHHASSNQLQVLLPVHLAKGDSVHNYIGVSPAVVDGGEQNVMDTCSHVNNDSDSYGSIIFCGDDSGGVCFGGKTDSSSGSCAEIPYVDHVSNGNKGLYGETNKFTDYFADKLGGCLVKEDKMDITCAGDNFLNKLVHDETFMYMDCQKQNEQIDHDCLDPYLTVNIGSIVSKEEDGHSKSHYVSETNVRSGTLWDSDTVLTKSKCVNELLELSQFKTFEAGAGESVCSVVGGQKVEVQAVNQNQVRLWYGVSDKDTGTIDGPAIYGGNVSREDDLGADDNIGAGANVSGNENGINGVVSIGNGIAEEPFLSTLIFSENDQKDQAAKDQEKVNGKEKIDEPLEETLSYSTTIDSDSPILEVLDHVNSFVETFQGSSNNENVDHDFQIGIGCGHVDNSTGTNVEWKTVQGSGTRRAITRWQVSLKSQRGVINGVHASPSSQTSELTSMQNYGSCRYLTSVSSINKVWSRKFGPQSDGGSLKAGVQKNAYESNQTKNHEFQIQLIVRNDEELSKLLGDVTIANDGGANVVVDDSEHDYDLANVNMGNNAFDAQFVPDSISICRSLFTALLQFPCELHSAQGQAYQFAQGQASDHVPTRFKDGFDNCQDLGDVPCVAPSMMKPEISSKHNGTFICSEKYTTELTHGAGIDISRSCLVPCKSDLQMLKIEGSHGTLLSHLSLLRCTVGALQYVSFSRPDTIFVAKLVCQFNQLMSSLKGYLVLRSRCIAPISACLPLLRLRGDENDGVLMNAGCLQSQLMYA